MLSQIYIRNQLKTTPLVTCDETEKETTQLLAQD